MHAMWPMLGVLACLAVAYRYYSAFLAAKVAVLDPGRPTPATAINDGHNYHPTHKWVLFGHHFAAISGAGPLIGPVLAIQFGYLPGLVWIVVGVCLAGAVQDMLVLAASVRRGGKSLAEIARMEIGARAGAVASLTILFTVIVALAGLGIIVVKALGGDVVKLAKGTVIQLPEGAKVEPKQIEVGETKRLVAEIPEGSSIRTPDVTNKEGEKLAAGVQWTRSEKFRLVLGAAKEGDTLASNSQGQIKLPAGVVEQVPGSSWGAFTIFCTIPIALFVGLYMYKIRKGRVVEASLIGAAATLAATVLGASIPGSPLESWFSLSKETTILCLCGYGFVASVLPVWLLLCPRDYLSSFLKIGTIILLVLGVLIANPELKAPSFNQVFAGGGPTFPGAVFPFCFICIMCGAISGFHSLVSSGTTPKMISSEKDIPLIGYGAMLIEGLVGVVALLAAATLPMGDYYAINVDPTRAAEFAVSLKELGADTDQLADLERKVGGEALRGRTGGAVTLAVGMSSVLTQAASNLAGDEVNLDAMIKYWFHFAIMFEALFILTTIDTGTRIARFLLQEALGKLYKPLEKTDWMPGAVLTTLLVTVGWGGLIWFNSIDTIWPMFGIANQMLAVVALAVVTTVMVNSGRARYAWATVVPMLFVTTTTTTAAYLSVFQEKGWAFRLKDALEKKNWTGVLQWSLNSGLVMLIVLCVLWIVCEAVAVWLTRGRSAKPSSSPH